MKMDAHPVINGRASIFNGLRVHFRQAASPLFHGTGRRAGGNGWRMDRRRGGCFKTICVMAKFKLMKRKKLQDGDGPEVWHAIPVVASRLDARTVCRAAMRNTTIAPAEAELVLSLLCDGIVHELQLGNSVQLGSLGWMRLSFSSEGVTDVSRFDAASMMKNVKLVFTPSKELLEDIKDGLAFENAGVVSGGFTFPDAKSFLHYRATGALPGAGGGSAAPADDDSQAINH